MEQIQKNPVKFSCHASDARAVFVVGSFNEWNPETLPLTHQPNGDWDVVMPLALGHHEFKFVVDGQWSCEVGCEHEYQGCPKCCTNEFGTMNRLLEVS